jgi:IS605 OrfB family transposase
MTVHSAYIQQRKIALLRQGKYCGDGRIGHGRKKRVQPVDNIGNAIARFRDTVNHKYSRAVVDFAVKMNCGVIQMENLTSITENANRFLKNWTYYDLQTKIKNKAQEAGIKVILINPKYTSQRCSKCGYIDSENRKTQAQFICLKCGFTENADYNASQNIALKDIEKIIQQTKSESANDK